MKEKKHFGCCQHRHHNAGCMILVHYRQFHILFSSYYTE